MLQIISAVSIIYSIIFMLKTDKSKTKDGPLTKIEKISVIITEILSPVLAGAIYYYGWRKNHPIKASQANKYSFIIFLFIFIIAFSLGFLGATLTQK